MTPHLTTLGKYVGGGMSFDAFGGRAALMATFDPRRADAMPHAGTFNNNTLTMSAGIGALGEVCTPAAAIAHDARGDAPRAELNAIAARHGVPLHVTGQGSIMGFHVALAPLRNAAEGLPPTRR
ncbi:aminotransferase class III-fold pyridoxal phosphate-dependent enzyme [Falsiroseomonas sp.]|uniref:aminotransferase class III-fold pyridoxal phosphate-dependent enzyme n=1 Tax=Falsiroseomonas sp. TaxID=2870721 RepID=UPI003563E8DB